MAQLFLNSCGDRYATADISRGQWTSLSGNVTGVVSAGNGRNGTNSLRSPATADAFANTVWKKTLTPSGNGFVFGLAIKTSASGVGVDFAAIVDVSTIQVTVRLNADNTISVTRGGTTVLGTSSASLSNGVYAYIECKGTIHDTTGTLEVRLNGSSTPVIGPLTGLDTQASGNASWNVFQMGKNPAIQAITWNSNVDLDDVYVLDQSGASTENTFWGDTRIAALAPNGESASGGTNNWTPSTGTDNSALVDDATPNDDTDYNETGGVANEDTYTLSDLPVSNVTVLGTQLCALVKKTDAGTSEVAGVFRPSATSYPAASRALSTSYTYELWQQHLNPSNSGQWVENAINGLEVGIRKTV